ncbi:MAG: Na/Pi cotransporter family protein [Gammaproteobacteria bacterium]|nr:Na/Pi cotransporter family protein [Gammaproteobacteria bacterium]
METLTLTGTILGGLGLFLLAIGMMTDGLKLAAGSSLRRLLSKTSRTPLRGIVSGFVMTSVVQSSSAVTVASLGFVNAGLISMRHALGIIYGANVGTTMTGWLVALIGFKLNIQVFALPLIGVGMLMKLFRPGDRIGAFGLALVGFGLFFVGIDILKGAFEGMVQAFDISQFTADGLVGVITFLLVGIVMTILTQSSSAAIALTITAASSGVVGVYAAAAMVIGANIGTTSTALIASIGATSNAKRVAAAQVIFNATTALVALGLLPVLFYLINFITGWVNVEADVAVALALFHTIFNILGVMLIYPLNDRLATFLENRFEGWEEQASHPKYLDKTIAQTPDLAVNALMLELSSISEKILALYSNLVLQRRIASKQLADEIYVIKSLSSDVSQFIVSIESSALGEDTSNELATLMRVDQYFLTCTISLERLALFLKSREALTQDHLEQRVVDYFLTVYTFMELSGSELRAADASPSTQYEVISTKHDAIKAALIQSATNRQVTVEQMSNAIDCLAEGLRIAEQWLKAFSRLHALDAEHSKHVDDQ